MRDSQGVNSEEEQGGSKRRQGFEARASMANGASSRERCEGEEDVGSERDRDGVRVSMKEIEREIERGGEREGDRV